MGGRLASQIYIPYVISSIRCVRGGMNGKISAERWNVGDFFVYVPYFLGSDGVGVHLVPYRRGAGTGVVS